MSETRFEGVGSCTLNADERVAEKDHILSMFDPEDMDELNEIEQEFITRMKTAKFVSVKQLFWLRDIKDSL